MFGFGWAKNDQFLRCWMYVFEDVNKIVFFLMVKAFLHAPLIVPTMWAP